MNLQNKRSVSPLIATILLIVVSVILITVVLTWGSDFARDKLSTAKNTSTQTTDLTGLVSSKSISSQNILISNNSSKDLNVTGYKIISSIDHYLYSYFENKIYNLEEPLIINPNSAQTLQIDCYPENTFFIDLLTDQNTYVRTQISAGSINDIDPFRCGLVGWWGFEETDNTIVDFSRNSLSGKIVGTILRRDKTECVRGNCLESFLGSGNYVNIFNDSKLNVPENLTVSMWVKPKWDETETFLYVVHLPPLFMFRHRGDSWGNKVHFLSGIEEPNAPGDSSWGNYGGVVTTTQINEDRWYNLVGVLRDNDLIFYVDGVKNRELLGVLDNYTKRHTTTNNLIIGRGSFLFDEFRVYNRALLPNEILDLYNLENTN